MCLREPFWHRKAESSKASTTLCSLRISISNIHRPLNITLSLQLRPRHSYTATSYHPTSSKHPKRLTTPPRRVATLHNGQLPRQHLRHRAGQSQLQFLLQNRGLPSRRPLLPEARQALLLPNHPPPQPLPKPGLSSWQPHESRTDTKPL